MQNSQTYAKIINLNAQEKITQGICITSCLNIMSDIFHEYAKDNFLDRYPAEKWEYTIIPRHWFTDF